MSAKKPLQIVVLHWHKHCPECDKDSCFYMDFAEDDGCKFPSGLYECDNCHAMIVDEDFHALPEVASLHAHNSETITHK